jgi:hypothetical protein
MPGVVGERDAPVERLCNECAVMDLSQYGQYKFAIADFLRRAGLATQDSNAWRTRTIPLFTRLTEDRFNLVPVGRFSRGKSSLVSAILGMDRLPTGIVPLTSANTSVSYGSVERVVLHFTSSWLDQDIIFIPASSAGY